MSHTHLYNMIWATMALTLVEQQVQQVSLGESCFQLLSIRQANKLYDKVKITTLFHVSGSPTTVVKNLF